MESFSFFVVKYLDCLRLINGSSQWTFVFDFASLSSPAALVIDWTIYTNPERTIGRFVGAFICSLKPPCHNRMI